MGADPRWPCCFFDTAVLAFFVMVTLLSFLGGTRYFFYPLYRPRSQTGIVPGIYCCIAVLLCRTIIVHTILGSWGCWWIVFICCVLCSTTTAVIRTAAVVVVVVQGGWADRFVGRVCPRVRGLRLFAFFFPPAIPAPVLAYFSVPLLRISLQNNKQ